MNDFAELQQALKTAFTQRLTPEMKIIFPKGTDEDITAVVACEFEIIDQMGQLGLHTEEAIEKICCAAEEKALPHYVALRSANDFEDLCDEEEDVFSNKLHIVITQACEKAKDEVMAKFMSSQNLTDPLAVDMNSPLMQSSMMKDLVPESMANDPLFKTMLAEMFTPSEPGAVITQVGIGGFGMEEDIVINFPRNRGAAH